MATQLKPVVTMEDTIDKLDIRLGRILTVDLEPSAPKKSYKITADFGKFGTKTTVGRFTIHAPEELIGKQVIAILNLEPRPIGDVVSEFYLAGVQYPRAESGEATIITPLVEAKIGGKMF